MKKTILVVAVAGLSVLAVAQSEKKKEEAKPATSVVAPRDSSTGMASGKKGNWDIKEAKGGIQDDSQSSNAREAQSGMATGKVQNVSTDAAQTADHTVKSPRDAASGQASGKRQHQPVTMTTSATEETNKPAEPKKK
ncbi:MAG TPA: hypothetical protein VLK33_21465 [Terriglobales bacterium]|nr:hypothetical protein [Terriglobales bacterium]